MARAGQGGRPGSSGRSSSRTSGGHQVSRPSSNNSRSSSSNNRSSAPRGPVGSPGHYGGGYGPSARSGQTPPPPPPGGYPPPPPRGGFRRTSRYGYGNGYGNNYGNNYGRNYRTGRRGVNWSSIIAIFLVLGIFGVIILLNSCSNMFKGKRQATDTGRIEQTSNTNDYNNNYNDDYYDDYQESNGSNNTYNRARLDSGIPYNTNCIIDKLGWFDDLAGTEKELEEFYELTGVQPYIVLMDYQPQLTSEDDKIAFAEDWYEANIDNEATFLFMYFADKNADEVVGYMAFVNGNLVGGIMDSTACDIFWDKMDEYWYSDCSTDELFIRTFNETAEEIMQ